MYWDTGVGVGNNRCSAYKSDREVTKQIEDNIPLGYWHLMAESWGADVPRERTVRDRVTGRRSKVGTRLQDSETGQWSHRLAKNRVQVAELCGLAVAEGELRSQVTQLGGLRCKGGSGNWDLQALPHSQTCQPRGCSPSVLPQNTKPGPSWSLSHSVPSLQP